VLRTCDAVVVAVRQDADWQAELCARDDAIGWQLSLMLKSTAEKADFAWTDNLIQHDWPSKLKKRRKEKSIFVNQSCIRRIT
jgi:hypothetical protein